MNDAVIGADQAAPIKLPRRRHILQSVDQVLRTASCSSCGDVHIYHSSKQGWRCGQTKGGYRSSRGRECCWCGYDKHRSALEIDHIDNDHSNDDESNLATMCSCCHAIKSWLVRVEAPERVWRLYDAPEELIPVYLAAL